jgi:hypothetical protein
LERNEQGSDILLTKLDSNSGNVEWTKQIGGVGDDVGINIAIGPNDKYSNQR